MEDGSGAADAGETGAEVNRMCRTMGWWWGIRASGSVGSAGAESGLPMIWNAGFAGNALQRSWG